MLVYKGREVLVNGVVDARRIEITYQDNQEHEFITWAQFALIRQQVNNGGPIEDTEP